MRSVFVPIAAVVACLAGCSGSPPGAAAPPESAGLRYISIGRDALDAALAVAEHRAQPLRLLDLDGDVAVVAIDARDLGALAEEIHARHDRCGGFIVHDSYAAARAALPVHTGPVGIVRDAGTANADAAAGIPGAVMRPSPGYTLDRAAAVRAVLPRIEADRIRDTIRELSAMQNRYYQSPTGAAASLWLQGRWRSLTSRPDVTVELVDHGWAQKSVVLTIPGTTRPDEVVVIGGHLDSIAAGGVASTAPGADDDASGIATITEALRALLAADYRPARTIQVMAYAAEEVGLRGSQWIANDYQRRGVRVVGALQLDMTNYQGSEKDIWLMKDFTSAAQNEFLTQLIDTYVGATWGLDVCGYACSDHASWHRIGVPASMPFESRSRDRNRAIHTRRDTLETSGGNAAHAVKFARLAAAYAIEFAKGELGSTAVAATAPASPAMAAAPGADGRGGAGSSGHRGAAACIAVFVAALWLAGAAARRAA